MVVSNCSPLRYFIAVQREYLLSQIFEQIRIPNAVFKELTHPSAPVSVRNWMKDPPRWLTVESVRLPIPESLTGLLDAGECESIQLALEVHPDFILIDELRGRREAELLGLRTIGALGVIIESHRRGLLTAPLQLLSELRAQGFRVSQRLVDELMRAVGRL